MRLLLAALASGCAIHSVPAVQLAESEAAIARAERSGAAEYAPSELRSAREKLELTRRWIEAKDYEPARWLAEQALVDAELAEAKALSARSRTAGRTW